MEHIEAAQTRKSSKKAVDPDDQSLKMINSSNKEVFNISFQNTVGQQSFPEINMYMHTVDGGLARHIKLHAGGLYMLGSDSSNTVSITPSSLTFPNLSSIDPKIKGAFWSKRRIWYQP